MSNRSWSLSYLAGVAAIGFYLSLSVVSFLAFPGSFSPLSNWLSDLGNVNVNTSGAFFYRLASITAGLALIPFFIGFRRWYKNGRVRSLLLFAQISGIVGAFSLVMTGIFSINNPAPHSFWSAVLFIVFDFLLVFSGIAFLKSHWRMRHVAYLSFSGAIVDFIFGTIFNTPVGEWITVSLLLVYVGVLAYYLGRAEPSAVSILLNKLSPDSRSTNRLCECNLDRIQLVGGERPAVNLAIP